MKHKRRLLNRLPYTHFALYVLCVLITCVTSYLHDLSALCVLVLCMICVLIHHICSYIGNTHMFVYWYVPFIETSVKIRYQLYISSVKLLALLPKMLKVYYLKCLGFLIHFLHCSYQKSN